MPWTVETLNIAVDAELEALPVQMRARFLRIFELVEIYGIQNLPRDTAKHLEGKLWEIRVRDQSGIARAIYITLADQRLVVLRVFVKKTQKTPQRELALCRQRAKEIDDKA